MPGLGQQNMPSQGLVTTNWAQAQVAAASLMGGLGQACSGGVGQRALWVLTIPCPPTSPPLAPAGARDPTYVLRQLQQVLGDTEAHGTNALGTQMVQDVAQNLHQAQGVFGLWY